MSKHFMDPMLLKSLGELWAWFESMPDLTKNDIDLVKVSVVLNDDIAVRFYEDGLEYEVVPFGNV